MSVPLLARLPARVRKWLLWTALVCVVYSMVGFFLLPAVVKWQLTRRLPGITKRQVAVKQVRANPWTFSLAVRGLALTEPDGRPFAAWDELFVDFQASSLFRWAWTFRDIRLVNPFGEVVLDEDGRLNFANMLAPPATTPAPSSREPASIPRLNVFRLEITNGLVVLEDRTVRSKFRTEYRPINVMLRGFTTRPNTDTPYSFYAESDAGRSLAWAGSLSVQPLSSAGTVELAGIQMWRYQPYLDPFTRAQITNRHADVRLAYRFAADTNGIDLVVSNGVVRVEQVELKDPETGEVVAGLSACDVGDVGLDFRQRALRVGTVKVTGAAVVGRLKPDGRLNLLDLLAVPRPAVAAVDPAQAEVAAAAVPWHIDIDDFVLEQGSVRFEDRTRRTPFRTEFKPVEFALQRFTTRSEADAEYTFRIASESAETFEGAGTISINPVRSRGEIKVGAVEVKKYLPYAEGFFRGRILEGKTAARIPYRFALGTNRIEAGVSNVVFNLTGIELQAPDTNETVLKVAEFGLDGLTADLGDRQARVGRLHADGGSVVVRREPNGAINLLGLLAVTRTNAPSKATTAVQSDAVVPPATDTPAFSVGGWILRVDELAYENYAVRLEDRQTTPPASFLLDRLALNVKGLSTLAETPVNAAVSFRVNETGTVAVEGSARIIPVAADFQVGVTNLDLRAFQPYVDRFVRLGIVSGAFGTSGRVRYQDGDAAAPRIAFTGALRLTNLVAADPVAFKEFARCDDLTVAGIDLALAPNRVKVEELKLVGPRATVLLGADGKPNLALIRLPEAGGTNAAGASATAPSGAAPAAADFPVELGTLALDRAAFVFGDESVKPKVRVEIQGVSGTVKGLSSALDTPAEVNLGGKLDPQSTFSVVGRLNPFAHKRLVDLVFSNANTQLTPLTGYLEKYGGHPLNKGRLSTTVRCLIQGTALEADNKIHIDQLTLGPRNTSPDALGLPLKLGIALLKDANGRIDLDIPLRGRLDDPEFSVAPIVWKIVKNLLLKAVTSPWKLLGGLVGGGGDELSFVGFVPGGTNLVEGELEKLSKLVQALAKRPALSLEIEGAVDPERDREALARQKLNEQLKAQRLQELAAKGRSPQSIETFEIEPEERDRLLRAAFIQHFGTNIAEAIQAYQSRPEATNAPAATSATAPKPKRNFMQRAIGVVGLGPARTPKAEKRLERADREALGLATPAIMEILVAEKIPVADEDLRGLMVARARWVQDWLLGSGQVAADRLFLVAPKSVDDTYRGASQVNLALE